MEQHVPYIVYSLHCSFPLAPSMEFIPSRHDFPRILCCVIIFRETLLNASAACASVASSYQFSLFPNRFPSTDGNSSHTAPPGYKAHRQWSTEPVVEGDNSEVLLHSSPDPIIDQVKARPHWDSRLAQLFPLPHHLHPFSLSLVLSVRYFLNTLHPDT
jgi:hypothetical protein